MKNRIRLLLIIGTLFLAHRGTSQTEQQIKEVQKLYKDYNENLSNMDSYEIKFNTAGSFPSMTIYTGLEGKMMVKTTDSDEFGSSSAEYYFKNDTVRFIYAKSDRLLDHWGANEVRFKKAELRFYFSHGKVIRALKKEFIGIEGKDDDFNMGSLQNSTIDHTTDGDANWIYFRDRVKNILALYANLEASF